MNDNQQQMKAVIEFALRDWDEEHWIKGRTARAVHREPDGRTTAGIPDDPTSPEAGYFSVVGRISWAASRLDHRGHVMANAVDELLAPQLDPEFFPDMTPGQRVQKHNDLPGTTFEQITGMLQLAQDELEGSIS